MQNFLKREAHVCADWLGFLFLYVKAEMFTWSFEQNLKRGWGRKMLTAETAGRGLWGTALAAVHSRPSAGKLFFEKLSWTMFRKHQNAVNASIDFALLNPENDLPLHDMQFTWFSTLIILSLRPKWKSQWFFTLKLDDCRGIFFFRLCKLLKKV